MSDTVVLHAPFAGWMGPIDEVPDPVFSGRMMGDGVAIDPTEGVLRAPADARVVTIPASAHAVTLALDNGAEVLVHLGLETVALGGLGFSAEVKVGDRVRGGDPLIAFDLDAVARRAKDMVTPIVLVGGGTIAVERPGRLVAAGEAIARVTRGAAASPVRIDDEEHRRSFVVTAPHGIHARPAARIVTLLKPYVAMVTLALGARYASGRSTVALLTLGARHGDTIEASATGTDAAAALEALAAFAGERFGDPVAAVQSPPPAAPGGGVRAAPGLAIGRIRQFRPGAIAVDERGRGVKTERATLDEAIGTVAARLGTGDIAAAHRAMLEDPDLRDAALRGIARGSSAGFAWRQATEQAVAALRTTGDERLVADLTDIERQILVALSGEPSAVLPVLDPDTILVAEDLLPSQFLALDRERLVGICTARGGPTAHVAILAAAAGVPMIVAAGPAVLAIPDGRTAILDANAATLAVDPAPAALSDATTRIAAARTAEAAAARSAHERCVTADGVRIEVFANIGSTDDAVAAVAAGAEGCGLLRTEFLFLDRDTAPDETEQRVLYARIAETLGDRPLIVRTLDIGGDKPVAYLPRSPEDNPALGRRGVRLSLARPDLLAVQFRAILTGVSGARCRIMLPMIVDLAELRAARALLDEAMAATGQREPVALGVMIETPAAALLADQLAEEADFLSIGTNDLTQYALAADRGNAAVSAMIDPLHPAVLRLIAQAATGAAKHHRQVGVCGGLASDPRAAAILIGLGVTELSAVPSAVPAVKAAVRALTMPACVALAGRALAAPSPAAVRALPAEETA